MAEIHLDIPSPSVFLTPSKPSKPPPVSDPPKPRPRPKPKPKPKLKTKPGQKCKRRPSALSQPNPSPTEPVQERVGVEKRKQSKSRNGCVTCKAKRLKCDETKPTCKQCARRGVPCGGYKKDYKWRSFEEASFVQGKPPGCRAKKDVALRLPCRNNSNRTRAARLDANPPSDLRPVNHVPGESGSSVHEDSDASEAGDRHEPLIDPSILVPADMLPLGTATTAFALPPSLAMFNRLGEPLLDRRLAIPPADSDLENYVDHDMALLPLHHSPPFGPPEPDFFGPDCGDFLPFGDDRISPILNPDFVDPTLLSNEGEDVEEIGRSGNPHSGPERFTMRLPEFYSSGIAADAIPPGSDLFPLLQEPQFPADSPEILTVRFDRQTCGILSIKDGPTENPWRTMIWPLARDSPALYHAIASMTSFHVSESALQLRVRGIEHMRTSIEALASGIGEMKFETAIATTLALAFAESWDTHTSTGINHIKGANILVKQAIEWHRKRPFQGERLRSLQFLCNAWVYMDVIARLTSVDDDESTDFDVVLSKLNLSSDEDSYLDPLMGAASTLFPIIGRVANLVRRVRRSQSNSPAVVSQAMELRRMLENWMPPPISETPEDPSSPTQDSLQTAQAYRWATLLYLHQAVPEIPSEPSAKLAKNVMVLLATVPLSSRTVIVHIYPLLAAGCEAAEDEDRQWVRERWASMAARMKIGVIDRCADVVAEVWRRRDEYYSEPHARKQGLSLGFSLDHGLSSELFDSDFRDLFAGRQRRATSSAVDLPQTVQNVCGIPPRRSWDPVTGQIGPELTVNGRLHWLGVMSDWRWEVLLG